MPPRRRTRVKICCIASEDEAWAAIDAGADALGLVAEMPSGPGCLDDAAIREIAAAVPPPVATFLLTSRTGAPEIAEHVAACGTTAVQVVQHVDPAVWEALTKTLPTGTRRIQVIHVEDRTALELLAAYEPFVHAFLLDSGRPSLATPELGGTGRVHDWELSREFVRRSQRPTFLAGGLSAENAGDAIRRVAPFGLDLCSGVRDRGALDLVRLRAFVEQVRATNTAGRR